MRPIMLSPESGICEFHYYDCDGTFIGKSDGERPDPSLFNNAHYVFDRKNELLKNQDLLRGMKKRLAALRQKLIRISVHDVENLMAANHELHELQDKIDRMESGLPPAGRGYGPCTANIQFIQ
ncbi:Hypothetical protein HDN1F_27810 [gamma proteobacterium HdN1]|nr:Hypothetical protein HDN1F_27810 [gamma proteobacterium HdN1]